MVSYLCCPLCRDIPVKSGQNEGESHLFNLVSDTDQSDVQE